MARATLTNTSTGLPFIACKRVSSGTNLFGPDELINPNTSVPFLEANSQSFKVGDAVYLNAGAVTTLTTVGATAAEAIAGFALTDATNVTTGNAQIRIMPVYQGEIYAMSLYSGTESSTLVSAAALLVGKMLNIIDLTVTEADASTTYCWAVNADATTLPRVQIVGILKTPKTYSTTTYPYVLVKFTPVCYVDSTHTYINTALG